MFPNDRQSSKSELRKRSSPNQLLAALPEEEYQRLAPHLSEVSLSIETVLYEVLEPIETVYFPNNGLISLVSVLANGASTEIDLISNHGMLGLPVVLDTGYSFSQAVVQVKGSAMKIAADVLKQEFDRGEELQKILLRYTATRIANIYQLATCNTHHNIQQRLARWLLTVQDLIQSDKLFLTQEFISEMLGVRRAGVTIAAGKLQQAGMISYVRGNITILDRAALEEAACECYGMIHH